jgi:hypothetical protein
MSPLIGRARQIADHLRALPGTSASEVFAYHDEHEENTVSLCLLYDFPVEGVTTYSTIGMSDEPVGAALGVELIAAAASDREELGEVLATAAFFVLKDGWRPVPQATFEEVVRMASPDTSLPHLYLCDPFLFQEAGLQSLVLEDDTVTWLLPVPISEAELQLWKSAGADALHDRLIEADVDLYDLDRPSVV